MADVKEEVNHEAELKTKRTQLRRRITTTCGTIAKFVKRRKSRTLIREYMTELQEFILECSRVNNELFDAYAHDAEFAEQDEKQDEYRLKVRNCLDIAELHLEERKDDAATTASLLDSETIVNNEASVRRSERQREPQVTERSLPDENHNVIQQLNSWTIEQERRRRPVEEWVENIPNFHHQPTRKQPFKFPDDWIEEYTRESGEVYPREIDRKHRGPINLTLETYDGNAMQWFEWISLFKALVHDAGQSPRRKAGNIETTFEG